MNNPRLRIALLTPSMVLFSYESLKGKLTKSPTASLCEEEKKESKKLIQAHIILRHGARTPVFYTPELKVNLKGWAGKCSHVNTPPGISSPHILPLDANKPKEANLHVVHHDGIQARPFSGVDAHQLVAVFGECRQGQLTDKGAEEAMALGRELRAKYYSIYARALSEDRIWIRTTNLARCVATLSFVLGEFQDNKQLPLKVFTAPHLEEFLYPNGSCDLTSQLMKAASLDWHVNPDADAVELNEKLKKLLPEKVYDALKLKSFNFIRIRDFIVSYRVRNERKDGG